MGAGVQAETEGCGLLRALITKCDVSTTPEDERLCLVIVHQLNYTRKCLILGQERYRAITCNPSYQQY